MTASLIEDRAARLAAFNAVLQERNLKALTSVGDSTKKGQVELLAIEEILDSAARFFTDIRFTARFNGGAVGAFTLRWNANSAASDGAVMVVVINGRIAMVRQWRPALGDYSTELPRGFGDPGDTVPLASALRELSEEVAESAVVVSTQPLGAIAENSGTHTATPAYWMIEVEVDKVALDERLRTHTDEGLALHLWSYDKAMAAIGTKITDAHSIVGLTLYRQFVENSR